MSATSSTAQSLPTGDAASPAPVPVAEIDASARGPLLFLFVSAAIWLFIASIFGMIATLKFHAPGMLADCPLFTYGRVHPAAANALIYGFAMQAGLGVLIWVLAHLGRTHLHLLPAIGLGAKLWNIGVTLGVIGILCGDSTGYEWLEMPRYATVFLFVGYILIALGGVVTFHNRRVSQLNSSQWFALAALFWFPWIFASAEFLLVAHPVRGALQAAIGDWYANNLKNIWFGFTGLAVIFYFIPKLVERPLHSHYNSLFVFWTLALFGSWGGIPPGTPLPAWLPAMSTMGAVVTIVPILAVAVNMCRTLEGAGPKFRECRALKFFSFGAMAYVIAGIASAVTAFGDVSKITNFTWFIPAITQLFLYGFFAISMLGAVYYIVPRLLQVEFPKPNAICLTFLLTAFGILFYSVPLAIGGIKQGFALNDPNRAFLDVMQSTLLFFRISTLGDLLMLLASLVFLLNLFGLLVQVGRTAYSAAMAANTRTAEVTP